MKYIGIFTIAIGIGLLYLYPYDMIGDRRMRLLAVVAQVIGAIIYLESLKRELILTIRKSQNNPAELNSK